MDKAEKKNTKQKQFTRQLINTKTVTDYSLVTNRGDELVYFCIKPTNISVLSAESITARIYALMTVLKSMASLEFVCINSQENFEDNKLFLRNRLEQESNAAVRKLLEQDLLQLDRMQVQMATAREFLVVIRIKGEKESEVFPYLNRIEKTLREQGFSTKRAGKEDIKRLLAIYFEQNVTAEEFTDYDGERWVVLGEE